MKKIITTLLCCGLSLPAFAKPTFYIDNRSDKSITVQYGYWGDAKIVPAHTKIENVKIPNDSVAVNFVDGKYVCNWHVRKSEGYKLDGIGYFFDIATNQWICINFLS